MFELLRKRGAQAGEPASSKETNPALSTSIDKPSADLVVEEYKACRALISQNITIMEQTETYAVGAVAASASFTIGMNAHLLAIFSAWIPLMITGFGHRRFRALQQTIRRIDRYIQDRVEKSWPVIGYTSYYRSENDHSLSASRDGLWTTMRRCSIAFGITVSVFEVAAFVTRNAPALRSVTECLTRAMH